MFYFPFHIWDVILPIDSYFSRWLLHHQISYIGGITIPKWVVDEIVLTTLQDIFQKNMKNPSKIS